MTNVLYHYTSSYHLPTILKTGYLKLTESNLRVVGIKSNYIAGRCFIDRKQVYRRNIL